ncbi:DUF3800 domain-containing protein [Patescibacteria group bacterium]|nr:DUF3800 domain-containing protein [Patescibacteria group bacterium]
MKIMFLDESGDHSLTKIDSQFPVFCLAGCIFDEIDYQTKGNDAINNFKIKYFNNTKIILHSREIRKCESPFNILLNQNVKKDFYNDLNCLISNLPFTVISSVIAKQKLKEQYADPANPYVLSLEFIMERFLFFLEENNDIGYISVESRDSKSNTDLLTAFTNIINYDSFYGNNIIQAKRFQGAIQKMIFLTKQQNENGHQVADLVAYPTAKFGLYPEKANPAFEIIKSKFRNRNGNIIGYGLKIFPNKKMGPGHSQSPSR